MSRFSCIIVRLLLIPITLSIGYHQLLSQQPRSTIPSSTYPGQQSQLELPKVKPVIKTFKLDKRKNKTTLKDTSLNGFEIYAPHRQFDTGALTLGNLGSSAIQIAFKERNNIFTDIGYHQYDIYRLEQNTLPFYELNRPYNELYFSPQSGQQNFQVGAKFSRNLDDGMNIAIDYSRIKQEGFYREQETKATRFGISLNRIADKHEFYFSFLANNFNELHNGGVTQDVDSLDMISSIYRNQRSSIGTHLDNASSRHQYFSYAADNFWKNKSQNLGLHHHIRLENGYYRFSDEDAGSEDEISIYRSYLANDRGLRVVNKFNRISNDIDFSFTHKGISLNIGASYRYLMLDNSLDKNHMHDASINASAGLSVRQLGKLKADARLAIGENVGNFSLDAQLDLKLGALGDFIGTFHSARFDAFFIQENFVVTAERVIDNSFSKINELSAGGKLIIDKLNLEISAKIGLQDNPVFYNFSALPEQFDGSVNYAQIVTKHSLFWKFIGFDNEILYQSFNNNIFQLPQLFSRHNLYLQNRFFKKKLKARVGIMYYNIDYNGSGLSFMPVNGAFYPSPEETGYYPESEVYITAQVKNFRLFFRYDNFSDLLLPEVNYQIQNYPQFDNRFRMGVRWIFFD